MGYESYEKPMISTYLYYDHQKSFTTRDFCNNFISILEKCGYFNITSVEIGKWQLVNGLVEDSQIKYNKKALSNMDLKQKILEWVCDDQVTYITFVHHEKRKWMWDITWHKHYALMETLSGENSFRFLQILNDYESIQEEVMQADFLDLFCNLADLFEAFYGRIEDVSSAVDLIENTRKKEFNPRKPQIAYWGNYFSKADHSFSQLQNGPFASVRETTNGVFVTATGNLMDAEPGLPKEMRKKMRKFLFK